MAEPAEVATLTIRIPMRLQRRGGKLIMMPEGGDAIGETRRDETLLRALVRAHRWLRRIERGQARSVTDLAEQEGMTDAYVCRLLPLTCLAPDIIGAILDGRQAKGQRLAEMLGNGPLGWEEQRYFWGSARAAEPAAHRPVRSGVASSASLRDDGHIHRRAGREEAMCWRSSSEYDLYGHTGERPTRSLFGRLRDLWRPRQPQVQEAEVVPFRAEAAARADKKASRKVSKAA